MLDDYRSVDENKWEMWTTKILKGMAKQYEEAKKDYVETVELGGRVCYALTVENDFS